MIIGAGSVVTTDIPEGTVYAGNPAKYICDINTFKKKHLKNAKTHSLFLGPCKKWWTMGNAEKENMKEQLKDSFGYMK